MHEITNIIGNYQHLIRFISIIAIFFILRFVVKNTLKKLLKKLRKKDHKFTAVFIAQLLRKFDIFAAAILLLFIDDLSFSNRLKDIWLNIEIALMISIALYCAMFFINLTNNIKHKLFFKKKDQTTVNIITKLLHTVIVIITLIIILHLIGVNVSAILAFSGAGGLVVGFAAKDLLSNIFGGFMIYFDKPFKIGDWIRSPEKEIEGTVQNIGWRQTRIITFANRPIYIPNAIFANIIVENPSRMTHRRINETIGIRYDDIGKMDKITQEVKQMLVEHSEIDEKEVMMVNFDKFSNSSVDFFIYTYTKTTKWERYHEVKHDVLLKISAIVLENKAKIAFPTFTSHVHMEPNSLGISEKPKIVK
jgi:MscS family membrane protein